MYIQRNPRKAKSLSVKECIWQLTLKDRGSLSNSSLHVTQLLFRCFQPSLLTVKWISDPAFGLSFVYLMAAPSCFTSSQLWMAMPPEGSTSTSYLRHSLTKSLCHESLFSQNEISPWRVPKEKELD